MKPLVKISALLSFLMLAGCATTESRIAKNQEVFDQYDPETQTKIKSGDVELGFDEQMIYIALGEPDRKYSRETLNGITEVWAYNSYESRMRRKLIPVRYRVRDGNGRLRSRSDHVWVDVNNRIEYERLRIEMTGGKAVAIERNTR